MSKSTSSDQDKNTDQISASNNTRPTLGQRLESLRHIDPKSKTGRIAAWTIVGTTVASVAAIAVVTVKSLNKNETPED